MIEPGQNAPDFELPDQDGNPVRLSGLRGGPVVLYFYPKADTPGCTKQACSLRDSFAALTEKGLTFTPVGLGLRVDAMPVDVGRLAAERSIVLSDLRPVEGGLEDLFLELTSDTQREDFAQAATTAGAPS